ncbi:MAG: hypothetical protein LC663_04145, partial [Actinobacteria bacterium]|nr:hypothetical protein [Actinomycetota bacterium]
STSSARGAGYITVRYNTLYAGGEGVVIPWKSHNITLDHNIIDRSTAKTWYPNIRGYANTGTGNVARNNVGYAAARLILNTDENSTQVSYGVKDGGGNQFGVDPTFDSVSSCGGFHPLNNLVEPFGRFAPTNTVLAGHWDVATLPALSTPGIASTPSWALRYSNTTGAADSTFSYGTAGDRAVHGDWQGTGVDTAAVIHGNIWSFRDGSPSISYGRTTDRPVAGDWNGDGKDDIGVVRGNTWYPRGAGSVSFGRASDRPVAGNWDGAGGDEFGMVRGNLFYLRYHDGSIHSISFGRVTDRPVIGDWNGDGADDVGMVRGNTWYLRNADGSVTSFAYSG